MVFNMYSIDINKNRRIFMRSRKSSWYNSNYACKVSLCIPNDVSKRKAWYIMSALSSMTRRSWVGKLYKNEVSRAMINLLCWNYRLDFSSSQKKAFIALYVYFLKIAKIWTQVFQNGVLNPTKDEIFHFLTCFCE